MKLGRGSTRRLTFLERRADVTPERFSWHWSTDHADIARRLPGMRVYEQNHTVQVLTATEPRGDDFTIDGIAESWYDSVDSVVAGVSSEAKRELLIDEPLVFSGLTGVIVPPYELPRVPAWKIWLLGDARFDASGITKHVREVEFEHRGHRTDDVPTMTRDALRAMTWVPEVVTELHFGSAQTARRAARQIEHVNATSANPHLRVALLTREVRIF